jgi:uncharacterized protein YjiS (DUF1127 family)
MAFATKTLPATSGLTLDFSAVIFHAFQRLQDHRAYRQTVHELANLSRNDLNDLGMNRTTIRSEAHKAVYGH